MENLYTKKNSEYLSNNKTWHIEDSPWKAKQIISILKRNNITTKSIVEIGCGAGEILLQLKNSLNDQNIEFSGYDISPDVVDFWKERTNDQLHFFHENLIDKDIHFDLLLMMDVFEHVQDYFSFIKNASSKANYKIYHIPLDISVMSTIRNMQIDTRRRVGHLHYFMKDTALSTLVDCGQEIIDYSYTASSLELGNKKLRTIFLNFLRKPLFKINQDLAVRLFGGYSLIVLTK